ncbi:MAG: sulfatase [Fimbriimonadales bacterium]
MIAGLAALALAVASRPPNVVVIFCDDLGFGDLSCYGNRAYKTPNLDRMASEGMRFTNFYAASPACSPSRAALLTGCYPVRVSVPEVLGPDSETGLNPQETNIASMLRPLGYATACVGKWHLGVKNLMPTRQGFDTFFGLPYSHDMWPANGKNWPPLWLYKDDAPIEEIKSLDDQAQLTKKYTSFASDFIRANKNRPFFLYLPHSMPHVPLAASRSFLGKSGAGLYGDVIQEIDWSVGEILKTIRQAGLDKNTLVFFSSDNGPWRPYGDHAGSTGGLREGKGTTFEAGFREPGIFRWPGKIPAGSVSNEVATTMDLLPTIASLAGAKLPEAKVDGHDIRPLIFAEPGAKTPWKWFYYYWPDQLQAVRSGDWKLHVPHKHRHQTEPAGRNGKPAGEVTAEIGLALFDLSKDPAESTNVADQHPDVVRRLMRLIEIGRRELGDTITKAKGTDVRPPGKVTP